MKHIHQQNLCQSIISHNRYQIIHRRDKRTRRNCRVNLQLVKQHRHQYADQAGDYHCGQKRDADTAGKCKREEKTLLFHNMDENADYDERSRAQQQSI